jgi:hypothetical protein
VKCNVQGYELKVLRGGRDLLNRAVFVECERLLAEWGDSTFVRDP